MDCQNLLSDMERVMAVLLGEPRNLKGLSDASVTELEARLDIKITDIAEDGTLKIGEQN